MTTPDVGDSEESIEVTVVVDVANVMGSRPDGWWRDRPGSAAALLDRLASLVGRTVRTADGDAVLIREIVAVVEGAAKAIAETAGVTVVRAEADGDRAIAEIADRRVALGERVVVVTADRGLRARLPDAAAVVGPGWLNALIGR